MAMFLITALSIDTLVFDNRNFVLQDIKGLESPTLRLPRYNLPGQSGAAISNALYGERAISIKGMVITPDGTQAGLSQALYLTNRNTLINALSYKTDINGNLLPQVMTVTFTNGLSVSCQVFQDKPLQMGFSEGQPDFEEFQLTLVAPDPNLYSTIVNSTNIGLAVGGGTRVPTNLPSPQSFVLSLAPSSGGQAAINNVGANVAYPTITLTGPLTNPFIANLTTNQFMQLNMSIGATDPPIIINMNPGIQTILQNNADVSANKTLSSSFWGLFKGTNVIGFSASAGTGTANVSFFPSFSGV